MSTGKKEGGEGGRSELKNDTLAIDKVLIKGLSEIRIPFLQRTTPIGPFYVEIDHKDEVNLLKRSLTS